MKVKVGRASGCRPAPPPSFMTGSVPVANATELAIPNKATNTSTRVNFTTYPRSNLQNTNQLSLTEQFHCHITEERSLQCPCNGSAYSFEHFKQIDRVQSFSQIVRQNSFICASLAFGLRNFL